MHFFERKTHFGSLSVDKIDKRKEIQPQKSHRKPIFEYEGKYESSTKAFYENENVA